MPLSIDIQRLWDQKYRDESVPFLIDGAEVLVDATVFTPESFGAVGDGVTDDTTAVQAAITAGAGRGSVYLSAQYLISRPLEVLAMCDIRGSDPRKATLIASPSFSGSQMIRNWTIADWTVGEANHRVHPADPTHSGTHVVNPYLRISDVGLNAGGVSNLAMLSWAGPNETTIVRNVVFASGAATTTNHGIWGVDFQNAIIGAKLEDIVFYGFGWERQLSFDSSSSSGANLYCDTITFSPSKLYHSMFYVNNVDDVVLGEYHLETAAGVDAGALAYLYLVTHTGFGSYSFRDGHMLQNASTTKPFLKQDNDAVANLTRVTAPVIDRLKIQKTAGTWTGNFLSDAYNDVALGTMEVIHRYDGQTLVYSNADGGLHTSILKATPQPQSYNYHGVGVPATVTIDGAAGGINLLRPTSATGFTIANPTSPVQGMTLSIVIWNDTAGALGTITWGNLYQLAGAFTSPAAHGTRVVTFYYDGPTWIEMSRTAADS